MADLSRALAGDGDRSAILLTRRERQVLELIGRGDSSAEIAERLSISVRTVESHRGRIARKLGLRGPNALMRFASQRGTDKD